jgi:Arc/MetJ-type ribon-helix-helix transcriptional regulator
MTKEVQDIAKEERRSVSELVREALRQYATNRLVKDIRKTAGKSAKKQGIKPQDIDRIIHEGRR